MESVGVLAAGIAIVWLIIWTIRNERAKRIDEQKGLFRMRDWAPEEDKTESGERSTHA